MHYKSMLIMFCSVFILGCEKPIETAPPPRPALVMIASDAATNESMILVGEIKSRYESNQGFRINGKIIERKVELGQQVKKGQLLARIDPNDTQLNLLASNADVKSAEASLALANVELERQQKLIEKKFISQSALDVKEAEVKTATARLQQAKAQAAASNNQNIYTDLKADRDGIITQIQAEPGQVVTAGERVAQIADTSNLEVLVAVPESRIKNVKMNDPVTVKLWASSQKSYQGHVREIAPMASDATRAFDVRIALPETDAALKMGMTAGVQFLAENNAAIVVPNSALTQIDGKSSVWVIDSQGVANPRTVTAGEFTENGVRISTGLNQGEMVAIAGVHTLIKGQKVVPQLAQSKALQ